MRAKRDAQRGRGDLLGGNGLGRPDPTAKYNTVSTGPAPKPGVTTKAGPSEGGFTKYSQD